MRAKLTVRTRDAELQSFLRKDVSRQTDFLAAYRLEGSMLVKQEMRVQAPYDKGTLVASITSRPTPSGFVVYPAAEHAIFVVKGTGPHEIKPRRAKALRFFPSALYTISRGPGPLRAMQAGLLTPIFAKRVMHPGTKPNPFIRRTADAVRDRLRDLAYDIWGRMFH